jgi:hypothetical protein
MLKKISFFSDKIYRNFGQPKPMKEFVPEWYRLAETTYVTSGEQEESPGLKKCVPFLDAMISGYAITTPYDIYVSRNKKGEIKLGWNLPKGLKEFIAERPKETGATMPRPAGHYPNHLVWVGFWGVKAPKGYSILVTHPLNRFDLPFTTMSALMDSDKFFASGNIPFFIKEGFEGVIPAGTPVAQYIPVKRDSWIMDNNNQGLMNFEHQHGEAARNPETSYKKKQWVRKEYK